MKKKTHMNKQHKHICVIISGGGTGGHIFPAIAIANALREAEPDIRILFIGANGRMEMEKVPEAGYEITGLPISGLVKKVSFSTLMLPFRIIRSLIKARSVIRRFNPAVVVGVGGYASGPALWAAQKMGISTVIQEQNAFPGKTNRLLAKKVSAVCTAHGNMGRYFPEEKIHLTGNPVRKSVVSTEGLRDEAIAFFNLSRDKKTILFVGGSQGAGSINRVLSEQIRQLTDTGLQVIWQTGRHFDVSAYTEAGNLPQHISINAFINRMELAYAAADLVVSRAGAIAIAEICLAGLPAIYVPFPYAADDHQVKNAREMEENGAAIMIKDDEIETGLIPLTLSTINNTEKLAAMHQQAGRLAKADADKAIANIILNLAKKREPQQP